MAQKPLSCASDDLNQPIDKATAGAFDALVARLIANVADRDDRPKWNDSSFFKRFAHREINRFARSATARCQYETRRCISATILLFAASLAMARLTMQSSTRAGSRGVEESRNGRRIASM